MDKLYNDLALRISKTPIQNVESRLIAKIKKDIGVHTKGNLFDKVVSAYENENPVAKMHVLKTYEPITKDGVWRGINNIARIFMGAEMSINGNATLIDTLLKDNFLTEFFNEWIEKSVSNDPNSVVVWMPNDEGKWEFRFIESDFIFTKDDDSIIFIDEEKSEYVVKEVTKDYDLLMRENFKKLERDKNSKSYVSQFEYAYTKKVFIEITKNTITQIERLSDGSFNVVPIHTFKTPLSYTYSYTGTEEVTKNVYHSPISPYIPWANLALIEHRTKRAVDAMFSYPRLVEPETACESNGCIGGKVACDITEATPNGETDCSSCKGTGRQSNQSPYNIYSYKVDSDPMSTKSVPMPMFITPDVGILNYNAEAYLKTLKKAEESLYIMQRQTGNVETFKSKEASMSEMYSWLSRIANYVYCHIEKIIQIRHEIEGLKEIVSINKPTSYAILTELDGFEIMNTIVSSKSPIVLKSNQIDTFINKYTNANSSWAKQIQVLKMVDAYALYNNEDFNNLNDTGLVPERLAQIHSLSQPLLQMLIANDMEIINADTSYLAKLLETELAKYLKNDIVKTKLNG